MVTNTALDNSTGLKRKLSSLLTLLSGATAVVPFLSPLSALLQSAAGLIGAAGVAHATVAGTWQNKVLVSLASAVAALLTVSHYVPALQPYTGALQQVALILGSLGIGASQTK